MSGSGWTRRRTRFSSTPRRSTSSRGAVGRSVGRISAHVDRNFNSFQDNEWGLFGWFECVDDPEAARALLYAAEGWLRERGRDRMVGPMDFTTNDECGLLIEGHEHPPIILSPWHHPYYQRLFEQELGMQKAMDLYMWRLYVQDREKVHPAIWETAEKLESEHGIVCRNFRKKDLQAEVGRFVDLYNSAWERNWGFVPLTEEEVRHYAKDLKPVLDENWAMFAERKDTSEVVGGALTLLDYNQVLAKLNGRLLPFGWLRALRQRKKIDAIRVIILGVTPAYRHTGVAARVPDALRRRRTHAAEGRGDGLDARGERADEPCPGRHGRRDQAPLQAVREGAVEGFAARHHAPTLPHRQTSVMMIG